VKAHIRFRKVSVLNGIFFPPLNLAVYDLFPAKVSRSGNGELSGELIGSIKTHRNEELTYMRIDEAAR